MSAGVYNQLRTKTTLTLPRTVVVFLAPAALPPALADLELAADPALPAGADLEAASSSPSFMMSSISIQSERKRDSVDESHCQVKKGTLKLSHLSASRFAPSLPMTILSMNHAPS